VFVCSFVCLSPETRTCRAPANWPSSAGGQSASVRHTDGGGGLLRRLKRVLVGQWLTGPAVLSDILMTAGAYGIGHLCRIAFSVSYKNPKVNRRFLKM